MFKNKYISFFCLFFFLFTKNVFAAPAELFGTTLIADISERVSPAVVAIESIHYVRTRRLYGSGDPFFDRFFSHLFDDDFNGSNNVIPQKGSGSGVIISDDGYLLTNEHVISSADELLVIFGDGRSFKAQIVGEWVIAIGNPFGLGITVTCGVVSAVKRDLSVDRDTNYRDLIQTDASINPGNSGGALVNSKGELIGINTAIMPSGQGIGFAIPVNRAKRIVGDLIKYGKVKKISAGLTVQNITKELAEYFNVPENGILITSVSEGSVAAEAGLVPSDIVTMIDNTKIKDVSSFDSALEKYSVGQTAVFKILRKGKLANVKIKFKETKASLNPLGVEVKTISDKLINKYNLYIEQGAVIVDIAEDSPTYKAGLRIGDVIIQIGNKRILNEEDLNSVMKAVNKLDAVTLRVVRRNTLVSLTINLH